MSATLSPLRAGWPALLLAASLAAQDRPPGPIQDNSFLVEEAYNQDPGVVQHINTFTRDRRTGDWTAVFTQEWPVGGIAHQLSYTLPWQRIGAAPGRRQGFGDVALNYRYQLVGDGDAALAVAPRFSLLLPTGDAEDGYGKGAAGYQVSLPVSFTLGPSLVGHFNAGGTLTPRAGTAAARATTRDWELGQSFVWLAAPRFNLMLEYLYTRTQRVMGPGSVQGQGAAYLSPGIRWAYDFPGGLQVVPGVAVPFGVGPTRGETALLLYLSFEHPFGKAARTP
ncbi:transporter [Geothrix sp. 21YS21S-4]|uniref:transporter n=1 Tax=Geothrix sp. 21YS21S-4 TaxID=3068889 RepID=UPI0027BA053F|nr:transporter [Geothrix sp. 21YS21S-4]